MRSSSLLCQHMKKIIFYILMLVSILLFINIVKILFFDFNKLTQYGFGYLVGKIILFLIFLGITLLFNKMFLNSKT